MNKLSLFSGTAVMLALLLCPVFADGQTIQSDFYFRIWGIENGLSQGTIPSIVQTADGYIWMATQESLSRFDGVRFFNFDSQNNPVLKSSWIQSLALDNDRHLLIGTWRGGIYEYHDQQFIPLLDRRASALFQAIVYALAVSADNTVWAGTSDGLFSIRDGSIRHFGPRDGIQVRTVRSLLIDRREVLWIGSEDQGLWAMDQGAFRHYQAPEDLCDNRIWALCEDDGRGLWIGSGHRLTHYDGRRFEVLTVPVARMPNLITGISKSADGSVWLGTLNEGLWRYENGTFSSVTERDGLYSDLIQSVFEDREQNIWAGSNGSGAIQLVRNKIRVVSRENGLSAKEVWTVRESMDGSLWIGTHGGGLNRLHDGEIRRYASREGLSSLQVTAIHESPRDQTLWVGTEDNGFIRIQGETINRYHLGTTLAENTIYAIAEQTDGVLLIGSAAGITYWKEGRTLARLTTREGLTNNSVREFVPGDNPGEFWVSTDIGLNLIRAGRVISCWRAADGLSEEALNGLYRDREGNLWICTYGGGLIHFKAGRFTTIDSRNGLHHNVVYGIVEDSKGWMWMSSNRGVFAVRKTELLDIVDRKISQLSSYPLGIGDGLKALECNGGRQPCIWLTRSGQACFATTNGLALLDTNKFEADEPAPAVIFEKIAVNGRAIPIATILSIKPGKRNLDIEFTAPSFAAPEKIRFQYRLLPFEEDWQERQDVRLAHYTNIPAGDYRFELRCSNRFGIWNGEIGHLQIQFQPFFYETLSFKILVILIIIGLLFFFLNRHTQGLKTRQRELEQAVNERTSELKEAYDKMEHLSLTDTLTSLFNRRYFHNIIDREISQAVRTHSGPDCGAVSFAMGFLMIDIDHFKRINDQHGHLFGDRFLQTISQRFLGSLRAGDLLVRWGGEEFLILSKDNDFEGARQLSQRLLAAINDQPFSIDDSPPVKGSISIGFCPFPVLSRIPDAFNWEAAVNLADQALYKAKHSGRGCAVGIRMNPDLMTPENMKLIRENYPRALKEKLIELVFERGREDRSRPS